MKFKRFNEFLNEGGWQTTKTQNTVLNPILVKKSIKQFEAFGKNLNKWLESKGEAPIEFVEANGSSGYVDRDLEETPDRIYGDVDYLVILPGNEYPSFEEFRADSGKIERKYRRLIGDYVEAKKPKNIPEDEYMDFVKGSSGLIFEIEPDVHVQIDFVFGFPSYKEWMQMRYTPEYNLKGFVTGNLFSSFAKILDINLAKFGVIAKTRDELLIPFSNRKDVKIIQITSNPKTLFLDVAKFLAVYNDIDIKNFKIDSILKKTPGLNAKDMTLENIANGIKGFAATMDLNNALGGKLKVDTGRELLDSIKEDFLDRNEKVRNKVKFDKAVTKTAKQARDKAFEHSRRGDKLVKKLLK